MLFVQNPNTDPYKNHALEEWLMRNFDMDCFMLWRNDKAILLGKNQNAYSEINMPYAEARNIKIVRRITGGGTVFTDEGNIMFTFISCGKHRDFTDFRKFTAPILDSLNALGIPAEYSGRNDLTIKGRKFSGNAQCLYGNKVLHHGTLMYKANTEELAQALQVREIKLRGKGVASVRSRVTNISEHMPRPMDIEVFRQYLFDSVMKQMTGARVYSLSPSDWQDVAVIAREKYAARQWIYGRNPQFSLQREGKFAGGIVQTCLEIRNGLVVKAGIFGDFFGNADIADIENALGGLRYEAKELREALRRFVIDDYLKNITVDELMTMLI